MSGGECSSSSSAAAPALKDDKDTKNLKDPKDDKNKDKDKQLELKCLCCRDTQKLICPASESKTSKCLYGVVNVEGKRYERCTICIKGFVRCILCTKCPKCNDTNFKCQKCNGQGTITCFGCFRTSGRVLIRKLIDRYCSDCDEYGSDCTCYVENKCPTCNGTAVLKCTDCKGHGLSCSECIATKYD